MPSTTNVVAARLPGGRFLIASLDLTVPEHHSPLRRALRDNPVNLPPDATKDRPPGPS